MASETITRNDLTNILNEVLPPTPSEYRKLLWTNPNPTSSFAAQTVSLDLSDYDEVEIAVRLYSGGSSPVTFARGSVGLLSSALGVRNDSFLTQIRQFIPQTSGVQFYDCKLGSNSSTYNDQMIPLNIYGIKYERVQPPVLDAEIEVLATGITLYRIGRIRALHISDATGFTKSSLIPSADRPSADIQGVAIRTTNGNLATSFGRIVVSANGDVGALYSSVLNGSQAGFSIASTTDHIIGTAIWYVAE